MMLKKSETLIKEGYIRLRALCLRKHYLEVALVLVYINYNLLCPGTGRVQYSQQSKSTLNSPSPTHSLHYERVRTSRDSAWDGARS